MFDEDNQDCGVRTLADAISSGSLSHGSLYGDTFEVKNKANANNIAYTDVALRSHQDMAYYESMVSALFSAISDWPFTRIVRI